MSLDPNLCIVVFQVESEGETENFPIDVPTRTSNGIELAWNTLQDDNGLREQDVVEIYSDWSATQADESFLKSSFPDVGFGYRFIRPAVESDWDDALAKAALQLQEDEEKYGNQDQDQPGADGQPVLLPVLRDDDDMMSSVGVTFALGGGLAISLANVQITPRETIGIEYVMANNIAETDQDEMFGTAFHNLASQLQIEGRESDSGEVFLVVSHPLDHGASAIALPDFYEQACGWLDTKNIFVGIHDPGSLLLAKADSSMVAEFTKSVMESDYHGSVALTPATFELNENGLHRTGSRPEE